MKSLAEFCRQWFPKSQSEVDTKWLVTSTQKVRHDVAHTLYLSRLWHAVPGRSCAGAIAGSADHHGADGASRQEGWVRIQSTINFFVAGPTGESEEAQKLRDRARRAVYEMAARECDLLRDVIAKDCRMESVSNNINRQYGNQQQEGFTITGSMNFQITLK
jgi:hypothetical protein